MGTSASAKPIQAIRANAGSWVAESVRRTRAPWTGAAVLGNAVLIAALYVYLPQALKWPHLIECSPMGMREKRIGIRELKSTLSECVREVKAGRTIVVTDHGHPVARMIPEGVSREERVEALTRAGAIAWSGRRLRTAKPAGRVRGNKTVADLVIENRE
jgi:prevent-host-death family protein